MARKKKELALKPVEARALTLKTREILEKECNRLFQTRGILRAEDLVTLASAEEHPLHGLFEWDDSIAADLYRSTQARTYISYVRFETPKGNTLPVYVNVRITDQNGNKDRGYITLDRAMTDVTLREQILSGALRELQHWEGKYKEYQELGGIVNTKKARQLEKQISHQ